MSNLLNATRSMMRDAVTITNPSAGTDAHGNAVADFTASAPSRVRGRLAPQSTADGGPGRDARTVTVTLYLLPSAPIRAESRVTVRGRTYEVVGEPQLWAGAGWEVSLRSVAG